MRLKNIHNVYFIGIGGIGMSAIARYFSVHGKKVAGYDKIPSPITKSLSEIGVKIQFDESLKNIETSFLDVKNTLVVYTPAVSKENVLLNYFSEAGFEVLKRAEVLGKITEATFCLAVSGTHGKTTTTAILGHIMQLEKATAFLGGIAENYNSNLILGKDEISVVEADEFDRSFLQLSPNVACVTSMDADHLDVYGNSEELVKSFNDFAKKVSGTLIVAKGLPLEGLTYAVDSVADYSATNIRIQNGAYVFDVKTPTSKIKDAVFNLPGRHNLMNAMASIAMADVSGVSLSKVKVQLSTFRGVQRRFSYKIKSERVVLIDDYAHHPTALNAVYDSVKEMYPNEKVLVVFQPHLYSRTRDFSSEFASALGKFDELLLLNIYPARELPIEGVSSEVLLRSISLKNKMLVEKENVVVNVVRSNAKVVVMVGAGDIGLIVDDVANSLKEKYKI